MISKRNLDALQIQIEGTVQRTDIEGETLQMASTALHLVREVKALRAELILANRKLQEATGG